MSKFVFHLPSCPAKLPRCVKPPGDRTASAYRSLFFSPLALAIALLWSTALLLNVAYAATAASGEGQWESSQYGHIARNEPLRDLLMDFVSSTGIPAVISPSVKGQVSGNFPVTPAPAFLRSLSSTYPFAWVYDGAGLYAYSQDQVESVTIDMPYHLSDELEARIDELGIDGAPIRWKALPRQGQLELAGPPRFIELVTDLANRLTSQEDGSFGEPTYAVKVFPVRYSYVNPQNMGQSEANGQTPVGLAELLGKLMNIPHISAMPAKPSEDSQKLRGTGLVTSESDEDNNEDEGTTTISPSNTDGAYIISDPRMNAIIVRDLQSRLPTYERLIRELDQPREQIQIDVAILDIDDSDRQRLGFDWLYSAHEGDFTVDVNAHTDLAMGVDEAREIIVRVSALKSEGNSRVVSRPSVLTLDNHEALFQNNLTFYVRLGSERSSAVDLVPVSYGSTLRVRPHIIMEGDQRKIYLSIHVEDGALSNNPAVTEVPEVSRTLIRTQAVINENESLLVGGHNLRESIRNMRRIPLLGRVPLVKRLFTWQETVDMQYDRFFIITPTIVGSGDGFDLNTGFDDLDKQRDQALTPINRDSTEQEAAASADAPRRTTAQPASSALPVPLNAPPTTPASQRGSPPADSRESRDDFATPSRQRVSPVVPAVSAGETRHIVVVSEGDTLWSIADRNRPLERFSTPQVLQGIVKLNPDAFVDGDTSKLIRGFHLRIPSMRDLDAMREAPLNPAPQDSRR